MASRFEMSKADRDTLISNRMYILGNLKISEDLLSYLVQTKVLNEDLKEEIEVEKLKKTKIGRLLDLLPKRGPEAFQHFIYALMESDQSHIGQALAEDVARAWVENQPEQGERPYVEPFYPPAEPHRQPHPQPYQPAKQPAPQPHRPPPIKVMPRPINEEEETSVLNPQVFPVDQTDSHMAKIITDMKNNYRMTSKPRGRAIIINNTYFLNHQPRDGAALDSMNICSHLEQLYFTTVLYDDMSASEIRAVIKEESARPDHKDADCILVFIMSHGSQGNIYGIDGKRVSIQDDIITPFDGNNCPYLVDKPKLFFIQACQGATSTEGVSPITPLTNNDESQVDATPPPGYSTLDPLLQETFRNLSIQDTSETLPRLSHTHEKSDIVVAYSTVPGYRSWRRTDLGSWFVRAIIKVFSAEAHCEDILSLLVKVRQQVAEKLTNPNYEDRSFVQLTRTDDTTRKKIYLFPGYFETNRGHTV